MRKWVFRAILAFAGPLLVLGCLEGALRVAGYGYPTGFFIRSRIAGPDALVQNDRFSWRFFSPSLARTPRPMVLSPAKPAGTLRVFVFGESAAYGDPRPDFGLPRLLQVLLQGALPDRKVEVLNVAMTGINSHGILPIARDCAPLGGDVWVIYMGNNEVVGPFGSGTVFGPTTPSLGFIRASLALKRTRVGQWLNDLVAAVRSHAKDRREWGMHLFLGSQVAQDDPRMQTVYRHFERNLADIFRLARSRGTPVVVSTVAANLKDCAPFASLHQAGLSEEQKKQWERSREAGRAAQKAGSPLQAVGQFAAAATIDDRFAELHWEWAGCAMALGRRDEALRHFSLARDYDALRFRIDSHLNEIIRRAASRHAAEGVRLADCEQAVAAECALGIAGEELLYEHVHLNFAGNYRAARCLAEQVLRAVRPDRSGAAASPWLSPDDCARRLAWTPFDECKALKSVMLRLGDAPFTAQLDNAARRRRLQEQIERLLPAMKPAGLRAASLVYSNALAGQPGDWVLQRNYGDLLMKLGDLAGAGRCYEEVTRLLPHDSLAYLQLGLLRLQAGRPQEAISQFESGLRLQPGSVPLLNGLAVALTSLERREDALRTYRQALGLDPRSAETHLNFSTALESWGKKEEALAHLRSALENASDTPDFRIRLGKAAAAEGWLAAAITNLMRAVELDPVDANANFYLGSALVQKRDSSRALPLLAEAVRLNPDSAPAQAGLGLVLLETGRNAEAVQHLRQASALDPKLLEAALNLGIALLREGDIAEARLCFRRALQIDPANALARKLISSIENK